MKEKKVVKNLDVRLTAEEYDTKSHDLAGLCQEIGLKVYLMKAATKTAKEAIEKLEDQRAKLATQVKDRVEYRDVECVDRYDFIHKQIVTVRLDTGEDIGRRAMELIEYQEEMDRHGNVTAGAGAKASKSDKTTPFRASAEG
jgi:hypothetical protein